MGACCCCSRRTPTSSVISPELQKIMQSQPQAFRPEEDEDIWDKVNDIFNLLDKNHDEVLDLEEATPYLIELGNTRDEMQL